MERAKAAVGEFMHLAGHHDTTVHEKIAPAVVDETIKKTRHDEIQTAVDREIHQDHYHTTIQPVKAVEVLPEQHIQRVTTVQERHVDHGNESAVAQRLQQEQAMFKDKHQVVSVQPTQKTLDTVVGEHVHHHVHETIQPVIQKEVIQPSVVHTTVPIHEVHHNEPKIHSVSALPPVSLDEFQRHGGTLSGREERTDRFEGDPKPLASALGGTPVTGSSSLTGSTPTSATGSHHGIGATPTSATGSHHGIGSTPTSATGSSGYHHGTDGQIGQQPKHNSSLLNKLDPRVDSNNDGTRGFGK